MQTFVFWGFLPIITDFYVTGCIIKLRSIRIKTVNNLPRCPGSVNIRYNCGGVLFFEPTEYLRGDPALHLQSQAQSSRNSLTPFSTCMDYSTLIFLLLAKIMLSGQGYAFCWWRH